MNNQKKGELIEMVTWSQWWYITQLMPVLYSAQVTHLFYVVTEQQFSVYSDVYYQYVELSF